MIKAFFTHEQQKEHLKSLKTLLLNSSDSPEVLLLKSQIHPLINLIENEIADE